MRRVMCSCRRSFTTAPASARSTHSSAKASPRTFLLPSRSAKKLRVILREAAQEVGVKAHDGGTYVNMDGPAFSTRAESELNRRHGFDVIGMTNLPEAKLAREAEIALATMAMITDYDCWKVEEEPVSRRRVFGHLTANAETAKKILAHAIPQIPTRAELAGASARSIRR